MTTHDRTCDECGVDLPAPPPDPFTVKIPSTSDKGRSDEYGEDYFCKSCRRKIEIEEGVYDQ